MVIGWVAVLVSWCRAGLMSGVGHGWDVERDRVSVAPWLKAVAEDKG